MTSFRSDPEARSFALLMKLARDWQPTDPQVKHGNALFCFIYKYRQRFAIVAEAIAEREQISAEVLAQVIKEYDLQNFYLKDLSCCDNECVC